MNDGRAQMRDGEKEREKLIFLLPAPLLLLRLVCSSADSVHTIYVHTTHDTDRISNKYLVAAAIADAAVADNKHCCYATTVR